MLYICHPIRHTNTKLEVVSPPQYCTVLALQSASVHIHLTNEKFKTRKKVFTSNNMTLISIRG